MVPIALVDGLPLPSMEVLGVIRVRIGGSGVLFRGVTTHGMEIWFYLEIESSNRKVSVGVGRQAAKWDYQPARDVAGWPK